MDAANTDEEQILFTIMHVFMPPKLPQKEDADQTRKDTVLLDWVASAAGHFKERVDAMYRGDRAGTKAWLHTQKMLESAAHLHRHGSITAKDLAEALSTMQDNDVLPVLVQAQNAGVIFRKHGPQISFESFEIQIPAAKVTGTVGKLVVQYPANSQEFFPANKQHIVPISNLIEYLAAEEQDDALPHTRKGESSHQETRDVASPRYITEGLAGILRAANTTNVTPDPTFFIHKRINDHVLLKSAKLPWRRSPMWLLIRVALQTTLGKFNISTELGYKAFMISFMSTVMDKAASTLGETMPSHLLHFMNTKLARRLYKIGDIVEERNASTLQEPLAVVRRIAAYLEIRWVEIQEEHEQTAQWERLDPELLEGSDKLTFDHGEGYLRQVIARKSALQARPSVYDGNRVDRELLAQSRVRIQADADQLPNSLSGLEPDIALYDFESWVERHLPAWKTNPRRSTRDCLPISQIIDAYRDLAVPAYDSKPELLSVMYLCILELWIALDMIVTRWCPLLLQYSPQIPRDLVDPLLLPYREHLSRLSQVQTYLNTRHRNASQHDSLSVFENDGASSFATRFFNLPLLGQPLRFLNSTISQSWETKKSQKISELDRLNEEYHSHMRRSDALSCTKTKTTNHWGDPVWKHKAKKCQKCKLAKSARKLRISPLEEFLPENTHQAQAVMFELQCPEPFSIWRDVTRNFLLSVAEPQIPRHNDIHPLATYSVLADFFKKAYPGQQTSLASSAKSISQSHYGSAKSLPTTQDQVVVGHAGRWALFDMEKPSWIDSDGKSKLQARLSFSMEGPYTSLQKYVVDTSHSPNSIIAALNSCPNGLSSSEYLAFSHLRAGNAIQWLNIARALSAQTLSFSEYSVFGLVLQAIWQVGPEARADSPYTLNREAHQDLADEAFGRELARELSTGLESIHSNWKQRYYLGTIVVIALKLHSLALSVEVKNLASGVLQTARNLAAEWIRELTKTSRNDYQSDSSHQITRNHHLAIICAMLRWTFDMELDGRTPFQTREDASQYINAIMVASPIFAQPSLPRVLSPFLCRDRRLALKLHNHLENACRRDQSILNDCAKQVWPSYLPGTPWTQLSNHGSRWWSARTAQNEDSTQLHVHLNLMDGTLLINGKSFNMLPSDLVCHVVYRELFNNHDVGTIRSSSMTGMDYEVGYLGHQIHLRLLGNDLIVRRVGVKGIEEFIPPSKLRDDLPTFFITGYHFWYLEDESTIEIRPISRTWDTGHLRQWRIKLEPNRSNISAHAYKPTFSGRKRLISPKSTVYQSLSKALQPLEEDPLGIVATINDVEQESSMMHAHIPRHDISFSLTDDGQLECQSTPGFVVQADRQGTGCLFGLESMLCLYQPAFAGHFMKVIIPKGNLSIEASKYGHPKVSIDFSEQGGCFTYDVDRVVGRLVGSRSVESDLFLILLHAYTSFPLNDPLTQRTGTEEALSRLRSGSIFSVQTINQTLRAYLDQLAELTPWRRFYPQHLRMMEMVEWHPALSPQSQSSDFRQCVEIILEHWKQALPFHQEEEVVSALPEIKGMDHLTARVQHRDWTRAPDNEAVVTPDLPHDSTDSLRTKVSRERELRAFHAVKLAQDVTNEPNLAVSRQLLSKVQQWETVTGDQQWSWKRVRGWTEASSAPAATTWCSLYGLYRTTQWPVSFEAQSALGLMAYMNADHDIIAGCIAIMRLKSQMPSVPKFTSLPLSMGSDWSVEIIRSIVKTAEKGFDQSDEYQVPIQGAETHQMHHERRQTAYDSALRDAIEDVVQEISHMWPQIPNTVSLRPQRLLTTSTLADPIRQQLMEWRSNKKFLDFIGQVQSLLLLQSGPEATRSQYQPTSLVPPPRPRFLQRRPLSSILEACSGPKILVYNQSQRDSEDTTSTTPLRPPTLSRLLAGLSSVPLQHGSLPLRYFQNLARSIESLEAFASPESRRCPSEDELEAILGVALEHHTLGRDAILEELAPLTTKDTLHQLSGMFPPISTHILLRQISQDYRGTLPAEWRLTLIAYAVVIQNAQRAIRMIQHLIYGRRAHLIAEFYHQRHWNAENYLDWLLVEIDGDFSIRKNQAEIASCMMHPEGHRVKNALMQLNMGEGKSSVIIPAISASLANGQVLCRVIVPRAQTKQQHQLFRRTLTDLAGRIIFSLPFNRKVPLDASAATSLVQHLSKMAEIGAVWLCEPDQILSLKLLGLDKNMGAKTGSSCGRSLIRLQLWLDENTRDILDESDDILNTKQQVIYTVGTQRNFDAAPLRWEVVQKVLGLLSKYLTSNLSQENDHIYVQYSSHPAGFPYIRIRSEHGREDLVSFIENSFQRNEWSLPQSLLAPTVQYISCRNPTSDVEALIRSYCSEEDEYVMQTLLILRGLFSSDILLHALKDKRFRVHYGLDLSRTPVAIPFRAKDFPSLRSEFGHPDVTIVLTCLSYYYRGLDDSMIHRSIVQLLTSNTPDLTYEEWLTDCWDLVHPELRSIRGINMDDQQGIHNHLYPLLRFNKTVIDFYLKEFVFPRYAKEFPEKLCTSGWDLAAEKAHSTTGFSGTNDGQFLLPTTISQLDRPAQMHTNAKVLDYLLLEENSRVVSYENESSSDMFLDHVMGLESHPTVILDVGAQILDKSNEDFAWSWLSRYNDHRIIKAAVYFDDQDSLTVITTDGISQPFLDSPYVDRLDQCLVYLDDAHTRGTDLRLPDTQAVVTLGPRLNKDKLVQGCMRMRRLGHGHTLIFMAPQDVVEQIRHNRSSSPRSVTSMDVVIWAILETWRQLQADAPAWMLQGESYIRSLESWEELKAAESIPSGKALAALFCEPEARSLEDLYGVGTKEKRKSEYAATTSKGLQIMHQIRQNYQGFEAFSLQDAGLHEEMEIELVHEKELEREVQRPAPAKPARHVLHPDVLAFVTSGALPASTSRTFCRADDALAATTLRIPKGFTQVFSSLLMTDDFCRTIDIPSSRPYGVMDQFIRPVEWIVTVCDRNGAMTLVFISPYEANALIHRFRQSRRVTLHIFFARSSRSLQSMEDLQRFAVPISQQPIPRTLAISLNLFSGALYIRDKNTYQDLCRLLRLKLEDLPTHLADPRIINSTGFVRTEAARRELGMVGVGFEASSLSFFRKFITMRRYGKEFGPSHMGKVLYGKRLEDSDFV